MTTDGTMADTFPLIQTKLYRPPLQADFIPRPRLLEELDGWQQRPLTLVSAPAATIYLKDDGKLRLRHRQRLALWKDDFSVGATGLILASTRAGKLTGVVVGPLMGSYSSKHRCEVGAVLESKLGPDASALVILAANAGWKAVPSVVDHFAGKNWPLNWLPRLNNSWL